MSPVTTSPDSGVSDGDSTTTTTNTLDSGTVSVIGADGGTPANNPIKDGSTAAGMGDIPSSESDITTWIIIGVVACLLCLVLIIVIVVLQRRRQKRAAMVAQAAADVYSPIGAPISPRTAVAVYGNTPGPDDQAYLAMPMRTLNTQLPPPPPQQGNGGGGFGGGGVYVAPDLSAGGSVTQEYNNLQIADSIEFPRGSTADGGRTTFIDPGYGLIPSAPRPVSSAISAHTMDTASQGGNTYGNLMPLQSSPQIGQYRPSETQFQPDVGNYVATDGGGYDPQVYDNQQQGGFDAQQPGAYDPARRSLPFPPPPPPIV